MQVIISKYLPSTNFKPSRIKASCECASVVLSWDAALTQQQMHEYAASRLVKQILDEDAKRYGSKPESNPWNKPRVCGQIPSGEYVHVFTA